MQPNDPRPGRRILTGDDVAPQGAAGGSARRLAAYLEAERHAEAIRPQLIPKIIGPTRSEAEALVRAEGLYIEFYDIDHIAPGAPVAIPAVGRVGGFGALVRDGKITCVL